MNSSKTMPKLWRFEKYTEIELGVGDFTSSVFNTILKSLRSGKPVVLIPRKEKKDED